PVVYVPTPPPSPAYALSLHDALPIFHRAHLDEADRNPASGDLPCRLAAGQAGSDHCHRLWHSCHLLRVSLPHTRIPYSGSRSLSDRKSTRLNSSHVKISYAVFCLKKK